MIELNTIQQDIATLPPEAQQIVFDLVGILKKRYLPQPKPSPSTQNTYEELEELGLIGFMEDDENLSTNYKKRLAEGWSKKYDNC